MIFEEIRLLNSLVKIKGGKRLPAGKFLQLMPNAHPYIRVRDIGERELPRSGIAYVPDELFPPISRYIVEPNDIVLSIVGTIGLLSIVDANYNLASLTENCVKLHGLDREDALYLYYFLLSPYGQQEIHRGTVGAVQPKLPIYNIEKIGVYWPEKSNRQSIALLLSLLDDRITLLRETNTTLEAIAQALFKSWFVDFDPVRAKMAGREPEGMDAETSALFPDSFEESELGLVPRGWDISSVEEVAEKVGMGPFGSNIKVSTFVEKGVPVISGQHLRNTLMEDLSFNFITESHAEKLKNSCVYSGDVVFTHAGNIGQVALIHDDAHFEKYVLSQRQFFLRCNKEKMLPEWITYFFRSPQGQHLLLANASQVGVPSIARPVSYLKSIEFVIPPITLIYRFSEIVDSLLKKVISNRAQIETLTNLRDTLLPRLISGQLRLPEELSTLKDNH